MTQLDFARDNKVTALMKTASKDESAGAEFIRRGIAKGNIVLPANKNHRNLKKPCAIGSGVSTKVNANIGTSEAVNDISLELKKLQVCIEYKADTVMDLSTGKNLSLIRKKMLANSTIPLGTVPIYQTASEFINNGKDIADISVEDMFDVVEQQAKEGVDFFTIHAGVTKSSVKVLEQNKRLTGVVSRGGAIMMKWINANKKENPFFKYFDRLLCILKTYDVTLSLGDGLRPGCIADATDKPQLKELSILGSLTKRAFKEGVQVMVEGPGHIPINEIKRNVDIQKKLCNGAPFYVLGPLVTDIGCGYDHITSAIGGALAASFGADFLCYVTPSEHLGLPSVEDVKEGIIAARIAAHAADIAKNIPNADRKDYRMSKLRKQRKWKQQIGLSFDPKRSEKIFSRLKTDTKDVCSMCGDFCPMKAT
ncbi:MAG: phosphomethylpyrimidine synthase ThiC [Candidatus Omnitrophota bacterium]